MLSSLGSNIVLLNHDRTVDAEHGPVVIKDDDTLTFGSPASVEPIQVRVNIAPLLEREHSVKELVRTFTPRPEENTVQTTSNQVVMKEQNETAQAEHEATATALREALTEAEHEYQAIVETHQAERQAHTATREALKAERAAHAETTADLNAAKALHSEAATALREALAAAAEAASWRACTQVQLEAAHQKANEQTAALSAALGILKRLRPQCAESLAESCRARRDATKALEAERVAKMDVVSLRESVRLRGQEVKIAQAAAAALQKRVQSVRGGHIATSAMQASSAAAQIKPEEDTSGRAEGAVLEALHKSIGNLFEDVISSARERHKLESAALSS